MMEIEEVEELCKNRNEEAWFLDNPHKKWEYIRKKKVIISIPTLTGSFLTQCHVLKLPCDGGIMLCNDK
jgi:hypothetical protein